MEWGSNGGWMVGVRDREPPGVSDIGLVSSPDHCKALLPTAPYCTILHNIAGNYTKLQYCTILVWSAHWTIARHYTTVL